MAVSYTHLDVYKRQVIYDPARLRSSRPRHYRFLSGRVHPVSYTHLDVYKRQQLHPLQKPKIRKITELLAPTAANAFIPKNFPTIAASTNE